MARKPAPDARERILDVACRLFDAHGIRAVGLQQIIDTLGIGKNLLYREFATKDELVVAYVQRYRREWASVADDAIALHPDDPAGQLVEIVRAAATRATQPDNRGCPVGNTHAEFPEHDHPAHAEAVQHYQEIRSVLRSIAAKAGISDPGTLADRLALIIDGVNVNGAILGADGAAAAAVAFAEDVVAATFRPATSVAR